MNDTNAEFLHWWEMDPITGDYSSACGTSVLVGPLPTNHVEPDRKCPECVVKVGEGPPDGNPLFAVLVEGDVTSGLS